MPHKNFKGNFCSFRICGLTGNWYIILWPSSSLLSCNQIDDPLHSTTNSRHKTSEKDTKGLEKLENWETGKVGNWKTGKLAGEGKRNYLTFEYSRVFLQRRISNCSKLWLSKACSTLAIVVLSVISPYMKLQRQLFCITSARLQPEILQKDSEQQTIG